VCSIQYYLITTGVDGSHLLRAYDVRHHAHYFVWWLL